MNKIKHPGTLFGLFIFLLVCAVVWLFTAVEDFTLFTTGAIETAASTAPLNKESQQALTTPPRVPYDTEVKYRKFFITAPGAKKVELLADFNRWGKDPIELKGYRKGYFETSVALTGGEYKYVFSVDGKDVLDPSNQDRTTVGGRTVCIKTVR